MGHELAVIWIVSLWELFPSLEGSFACLPGVYEHYLYCVEGWTLLEFEGGTSSFLDETRVRAKPKSAGVSPLIWKHATLFFTGGDKWTSTWLFPWFFLFFWPLASFSVSHPARPTSSWPWPMLPCSGWSIHSFAAHSLNIIELVPIYRIQPC